jgi:hypothetical protein
VPPRWGEVREFCRKQGYRETRTDHYRYVKVLPDRSTSGTMVSMGVDGETVPSQRWGLVWRHQLRLASEDEFWAGLRGEPARYAIAADLATTEPLPTYLVRFLATVLHYSEADIAALSRDQAQQLLDEYHARELREP